LTMRRKAVLPITLYDRKRPVVSIREMQSVSSACSKDE
jgi:hypothetical protein